MTKSPKESNVDVLIIGAGPAGLMAATWFARTGVNFRIIDKRSAKLFAGQADGLQSRTLEVFQSFGFADRALKKGNIFDQMAFWHPNEDGDIVRHAIIPDTPPGISRFRQLVLHQGHIEGFLQDSIRKWSQGTVEVERPVLPLHLSIDSSKVDDPEAYPVSVLCKHLTDDDDAAIPEQFGSAIENGLFRQFEGDQERTYAAFADLGADESCEVIHAKYVIGCDGAHSWVRKQIGVEMEGETTDFIWGVLDSVPITNWPDIRSRSAIHSKDNGSIMVIPRENDLVRLYIQLKEVPRMESDDSRPDRSKITPELIVENAKAIFKPYDLEVTDVNWFTGYQIGQRMTPKFQKYNRVFIAGDACHTHSPKAGQGMNISMMDTYNLGWKIAYVCKGLCSRDILETYETERHAVAKELIELDRTYSRLFSGKPKIVSDDKSKAQDGVDIDLFVSSFAKGSDFTSGTSVNYGPSLLEVKDDSEGLFYTEYASNIAVGKRFDSTLVVNQADRRPYHLVDRMLSDGRWRVLNFAGDVINSSALAEAQKELVDISKTVSKFTPVNAAVDSVIEVLTVHASPYEKTELTDFPDFLWPVDSHRRRDYWKIFCGETETYHDGPCRAYEKYGIDPKKGCYVVVRPDGYVSLVTEVGSSGVKKISAFFDRVLKPQNGVVVADTSKIDNRDRFSKPKLAV